MKRIRLAPRLDSSQNSLFYISAELAALSIRRMSSADFYYLKIKIFRAAVAVGGWGWERG